MYRYIYRKSRPIVFIGHSMGGILIIQVRWWRCMFSPSIVQLINIRLCFTTRTSHGTGISLTRHVRYSCLGPLAKVLPGTISSTCSSPSQLWIRPGPNWFGSWRRAQLSWKASEDSMRLWKNQSVFTFYETQSTQVLKKYVLQKNVFDSYLICGLNPA